MRDVLVRSIVDLRLGLAVVATIGEVISADARFNIWFGIDAKQVLTESELLTVLEKYEAISESCRSGYEAVAANAPDAVAQFWSTLQSARDRLESLARGVPA
jgi:hypothetical protein